MEKRVFIFLCDPCIIFILLCITTLTVHIKKINQSVIANVSDESQI